MTFTSAGSAAKPVNDEARERITRTITAQERRDRRGTGECMTGTVPDPRQLSNHAPALTELGA